MLLCEVASLRSTSGVGGIEDRGAVGPACLGEVPPLRRNEARAGACGAPKTPFLPISDLSNGPFR